MPLTLKVMKPEEYEKAPEKQISDGQRSLFDLVMVDDHSTERLPMGSYFFWGGIPQIDGVQLGEAVENETIINWDDTHPVLRHVAVDSGYVDRWQQLTSGYHLGNQSPAAGFISFNPPASKQYLQGLRLTHHPG